MRAIAFMCLLSPVLAQAGTLYLCKSYSGGTFWASAHCHQHKALIDRIVPVPDGLPFEQQVALGEQARNEGARLTQPSAQVSNQQTAMQGNGGACRAVDDEIRSIDIAAKNLQPAAEQERLARQKRQATSRRMTLGCR